MEKTKRVDTLDNLQPSRVKGVGAWSEQFSSNGRRYFYNRETEVSQWDKPAAWIDAEMIVDPDINDDDDRFNYTIDSPLGRDSDRCCSSPEKIDVSEDENSPMEEEEEEEEEEIISEEEMRRRALEAERLAEEEKERLEAEKEYNKHYGYRKYMDEEAMDKKYKLLFGVDRVPGPYTKDNCPYHLTRRVDDFNFTVEFDEKMLEISKARREAASHMYQAEFYGRKSAGLRELREEMEDRRLNFQANFESSMGSLVAQSKITEDYVDSDFKKRSWHDWDEKIVECHENMLHHRSDDYREKRARFMELYKPKEPTPAPSPVPVVLPPPVVPVILDERKLAELEVRSPSPSYDDQNIEMVVSPVYEDEYDPTARAVTSYSSRSSSGSSSPDQSSLLIGTEPFRTQEYTRPTSERPLEFILEPPPALPILDLVAIEASERRKRRSGRESESPPRSPTPCSVHSPVYSQYRSPRSPEISPIRSPVRSPVHSPPISPIARSPIYHPRSPDPIPITIASPIYEPLSVEPTYSCSKVPSYPPPKPPPSLNPITPPKIPPPFPPNPIHVDHNSTPKSQFSFHPNPLTPITSRPPPSFPPPNPLHMDPNNIPKQLPPYSHMPPSLDSHIPQKSLPHYTPMPHTLDHITPPKPYSYYTPTHSHAMDNTPPNPQLQYPPNYFTIDPVPKPYPPLPPIPPKIDQSMHHRVCPPFPPPPHNLDHITPPKPHPHFQHNPFAMDPNTTPKRRPNFITNPLMLDPTMPFFDPSVPPPLPPYILPPPLAPVLDPPPPAPVLDKLFEECEIDDPF